ncbi:hypothetical protein EJ02DRAFT_484073 [Clathrospora elynae]|uniref:Uncharacterized protein n=1 Tax=Clathrospora elynae TaxID=706981 RepID=A0A6A5S895_9PLEO|nr:hypothetical protein EJ02DRAFT_484073 [Clathrospora elynae]
MSYTQEQLLKWASLQKKGRWPSKLSHKLLLHHEQSTKNRIYSALDSTREGSFGDRQEFRILYEVFMLMPQNTSQIIQDSLEDANNNPNAHRPYWCLSTQDVNNFRIAECNRWVLGLEILASSAECLPGTNQVLPVVEQEINSLMCTAIACILRFSLGCLNPQQFSSIWEGKRWVKSRFRNQYQNTMLQPKASLQRRQGLDIKASVSHYGMIWIPHKLAIWSMPLPIFRIHRYPYLDISINSLRATLHTSSALIKAKTKEGKIREYARICMRTLTSQHPPQHPVVEKLLIVFAQMCVQAYNCSVWSIVEARWQKHVTQDKAKSTTFQEAAGLSKAACQGLEILCFAKLEEYLGENGIGIEQLEIAFYWALDRPSSTTIPTKRRAA